MVRWLVAMSIAGVLLTGIAEAEPVTIYAAASLTSAMEDLAAVARADGLRLVLSFGSSSTLAKQIVQGAPADIYVSANTTWMDYVENAGELEPNTRVDLVGNRLVVIAPADAPFEVRAERGFDFAGAFEGRLAIGDPAHVPAGIYAKQALTSLGWWEGVAGRLAPTVDVRAALVYVARGECGAGIVYATDAAISDSVVEVARLPASSHEPVTYPVAVMKGRMTEKVRRFMGLLRSDKAEEVFERYGFTVTGSE